MAQVKLTQFQDCIELIQNFETAVQSLWKEDVETLSNAKLSSGETKIHSLVALLRGEALESIDVRAGALLWYKKALEYDVTCYEAWKRLSEGKMLSSDEEERFLAKLEFSPELQWLKGMYLSRTSNFISAYGVEVSMEAEKLESSDKKEKSSDSSSQTQSSTTVASSSDTSSKSTTQSKQEKSKAKEGSTQITSLSKRSKIQPGPYSEKYKLVSELETKYGLSENEDVVASRAQAAFYAARIREAYELTSVVLERDPYSASVLMTHLPCLVELGMKNELYLLAHKMAENAPKSALSWYAVGCYYFLIRSWQNARLYFGKATSLKREFGAAWLAYGYTFAQNGDHDQALSAYRTAARILVGSHLPTLLIAVELTRAKDFVLAKQFALQSVSMQPSDPYPVHELAVILFRIHDYAQSVKLFEKVLALVRRPNAIDRIWEPTIFNLAQCYLKLRNYNAAIELLQWALTLLPYNASTYASLAFAYHMIGDLQEAIGYYHQALSVAPDHDFAFVALEEAMNEWITVQELESGSNFVQQQMGALLEDEAGDDMDRTGDISGEEMEMEMEDDEGTGGMVMTPVK